MGSASWSDLFAVAREAVEAGGLDMGRALPVLWGLTQRRERTDDEASALPPAVLAQWEKARAEVETLWKLLQVDGEMGLVLDTVRRTRPGSIVWVVGTEERPVACTPCRGRGSLEVEGARFQFTSCSGLGAHKHTVGVPVMKLIERIVVTTDHSRLQVKIEVGKHGFSGFHFESPKFWFTREACQAALDSGEAFR